MKYVPLCIAALGISIAVITGIVLTDNPDFLFGFIAILPVGYYTFKMAAGEYEDDETASKP